MTFLFCNSLFSYFTITLTVLVIFLLDCNLALDEARHLTLLLFLLRICQSVIMALDVTQLSGMLLLLAKPVCSVLQKVSICV